MLTPARPPQPPRSDGTIRLAASGDCIQIKDHATKDESLVWTAACDAGDASEQWAVNKNGTVSNNAAGLVLDISNYGTASGSKVWAYHPTGASNQNWTLAAFGAGYHIVNPVSGKCLDAGTRMPRACDPGQPAVGTPLCDASLPFTDRVAWVVNNLTSDEIVPLFGNGAGAVERLGLPVRYRAAMIVLRKCLSYPINRRALTPCVRTNLSPRSMPCRTISGGAKLCMAWRIRPASHSAARFPGRRPFPRSLRQPWPGTAACGSPLAPPSLPRRAPSTTSARRA